MPVLACCYVSSLLYAYMGSPYSAELARQLPGQMAYFIGGAFFYYYLAFFERYVLLFLIAALAIVLINFEPLMPFALATFVVFFALFCYVGNCGKYGDFSYGFYILHFPIIQLYLWSQLFSGRPWTFVSAVLLTTALGAVAMWHFVEKRWLARSSHYLGASQEPVPPVAVPSSVT